MSVYRTPKNTNFTVVDNHYLKNPDLSLKAKGLMTLLLSLPEHWNFSITGLATLSKDQVCAVRSAIHELEAAGHVSRLRQKDAEGKYNAVEYVIREIPENPAPDFPPLEILPQDAPPQESPPQLNTDQSNKNRSNNNLLSIQSYPGGTEWNRNEKIEIKISALSGPNHGTHRLSGAAPGISAPPERARGTAGDHFGDPVHPFANHSRCPQ